MTEQNELEELDLKQAADRTKAASMLGEEVRNAIDGRNKNKDRWDRLTTFYLNAPSAPSPLDAAGSSDAGTNEPAHHVALIQPNIDQAVGSSLDTITAQAPYMRVTTRAGTDAQDRLEYGFQFFADRGKLKKALRKALPVVGNLGVAYIWSRYYSTGEDKRAGHDPFPWFEKWCGMKYVAVHPTKMFAYPTSVEDVNELQLIGHVFYQRKEEIEQKRKDGVYIKLKDEDDQEEPSVQDPLEDELPVVKALGTDTPLVRDQDENGLVKCAAFLRKAKLKGDDRERWYRFEMAIQPDILLEDPEPFPLMQPWYTRVVLNETFEGQYPIKSKGNDLQSLQIMYNECMATILDVALDAAGPPVFGDSLPEGRATYKRKEMIETDGVTQPWSPGVKAELEPLMKLVPQIESVASRVSRIPQGGLAQQFKAGTTATEASILNAGQQVSTNWDIESLEEALVDIYEISRQQLYLNYEDWSGAYPDNKQLPTKEDLAQTMEFTLASNSPMSAPMAIVQKLQLFIQFVEALNPMVIQILNVHGIDTKELVKTVYNQLGLGDMSKLLPEGGTGLTLEETLLHLGAATNGQLGSQLGAVLGMQGNAGPTGTPTGGPGQGAPPAGIPGPQPPSFSNQPGPGPQGVPTGIPPRPGLPQAP